MPVKRGTLQLRLSVPRVSKILFYIYHCQHRIKRKSDEISLCKEGSVWKQRATGFCYCCSLYLFLACSVGKWIFLWGAGGGGDWSKLILLIIQFLFLGLLRVHPSCMLPKWQVVKLTKFFATFRFFFEVVFKGEIYWSLIKFSDLIVWNVWRSVWRIFYWDTGAFRAKSN